MLKREVFIKLMQNYLDKRVETERWINDVERAFGSGTCEVFYQHDYNELFVDLMTEAMDDQINEWLRYFIYEQNCNWFSFEWDDFEEGVTRELDVCDLDTLYDCICGNFEKLPILLEWEIEEVEDENS